jgi:hypothetical protein
MPPELEAKLIAPDELRLPDLSGLVKAATAGRLPDRHLESGPRTRESNPAVPPAGKPLARSGESWLVGANRGSCRERWA